MTLSGSLTDTIIAHADDNIDESTYLPFANGSTRFAEILGQITDGVTITDFQANVFDWLGALDDIDYFFGLADQSNDFQFTIPKEMFYGVENLNINRVDLKTLRASVDALQMAVYLANSWECDIEIGSRYDADGELIGDIEDIADDLNTCLNLKSENYLEEARRELLSLLDHALTANDIMDDVTTDGINESDTLTTDGYAEIAELVGIVEASLDGEQPFPYLDPAIALNLSDFFADPPSASDIEYDPFVVENGSIKWVEGFLQEALATTLPGFEVASAADYTHAFDAISRSFAADAFTEFSPLSLGGNVRLSVTRPQYRFIGW